MALCLGACSTPYIVPPFVTRFDEVLQARDRVVLIVLEDFGVVDEEGPGDAKAG